MVSTTSQILASFLLLLSLAFVLLIKNLNEDVEQEYNQAMEEPMVDTANLFASLIEARMAAGETDLTSFARAIELAGQREVEAQIYEFKKRGIDMNVYVTDEKGMVLFDSDGGLLNGQDLSQSNDVLRTLKGQYGARSTRKDEADDRSSVLYVGAPIHHDGKLAGVVSVSKPQASMFFFVRETRRRIYNIVLLTFAALALAGLLLSRWFSRPLRRLTEYSRAVVRGERQSPPRLQTREGKTLAGALEEMRDALENRQYVQSYVQTLTHEMKSPLSAIRGASELLHENMPVEHRKKFLTNIEAESGRLEQMIDRLLALAGLENRKKLEHPTRFGLSETVDTCLDNLRYALETKQISYEKHYRTKEKIQGEVFLVETAIANLLQNAIDFSPSGSTLQITVDLTEDRKAIRLTIEDEGPGIPEYAIGRVFDRFYSLQHPDTGKKSSGLGLCFVQETAELHGGTASLENREGGTGARASLRFPLKRERKK